MTERSFVPEELLELFNDTFEDYWPLGNTPSSDDDWAAYWSFRVAEGVGILKVNLRDTYGNAEDFEWELNLR